MDSFEYVNLLTCSLFTLDFGLSCRIPKEFSVIIIISIKHGEWNEKRNDGVEVLEEKSFSTPKNIEQNTII